jgi:hypothetical protein
MMNQPPQGTMQQGSPMGQPMAQTPMQMGGPMGQAPPQLGGLMAQGGMGQGPMGGTEPPGISMHPMIQALLAHLQSQQPQATGTPTQQMQGGRGTQGGPAGAPYGAYGAFYGDKMPMNTGLQKSGLGS